jgi:hypothetical protein
MNIEKLIDRADHRRAEDKERSSLDPFLDTFEDERPVTSDDDWNETDEMEDGV